MNSCQTTQYMAILEQGPTSWGAYVPDLPGCIAAGESRDEVLELIRQAVAFHLEGLNEEGLPIPAPHSQSAVIDTNA